MLENGTTTSEPTTLLGKENVILVSILNSFIIPVKGYG